MSLTENSNQLFLPGCGESHKTIQFFTLIYYLFKAIRNTFNDIVRVVRLTEK